MRKTKIICTIGPASENESVMRELILEGMNVARFNFSHGDYDEHLAKLNTLKKLRSELDLPVAALLDTKGPEIRLGTFKDKKVELKKGQTFTLSTREVEGSAQIVSITYKNLIKDIKEGDRILLDDGLIELVAEHLTDTDIICKVMNSGFVSDKKGVNVPGVHLSMPYISKKDREDILFGIKNGYDFIAASFARSASDILEIRKILQEENCKTINIIAKIENMEGVENIDEIIRVSDGIMIARGDMGVEIPLEEVPVIQKEIIKKVCDAGKQVITATQMLDSMMKNPRPTRAEATDVANAIYDGTSAIMLSGETAAGLYPVESLKTMVRIATRTENDINYLLRFRSRSTEHKPDVTNAISHATCTTAMDLNASAIITVTKSGTTARMISKYRPSCPIIGGSTEDHVCRQLNLSWGVIPVKIQEEKNTDDLFEHAVDMAMRCGIVNQGDLTVITAGVPLGISGTTNLIKVHVAGHILIKGVGVSGGSASGSLCVCKDAQDLRTYFKRGDIVVAPKTTNEMMPQLKEAAGIIVEEEGFGAHAAIVGLSLDLPVILGAKYATKILKSGAYVTIDAKKGIVCSN
ncbi:MAG: pyruvate kinase [Clostridiales bacterium]|nr:pyruvate kinase [Clostridiales bacterium]MDY3746907.1 pyruvate kinase [Lachnospiraceae bacterium]